MRTVFCTAKLARGLIIRRIKMTLETIDYRAQDAAEKFVSSLRETGFGVLSNHPINKDLVEDIYKEWHSFFNTEAKRAYFLTQKLKMVSFQLKSLRPQKATA